MRPPSHATIVAYLALTVALSGSAYAAGKIGSAQIKNNSVASKDIKNKTIKPKDLSAAARTTLQGPAGPPGAPGAPGSVVVNPAGTPAQNGADLKAKLAALPVATAASPQLVVLGVGTYDSASASGGFVVPKFVTLVGQGPRTVVTNSVANFQAVLSLGDGSVVRDLAVSNPSTTIGARGIDGQTASGTLVEGVTVTARTGILLRSATLRDASITATAEGLRLAADAPGAGGNEVDNVSIEVEGAGAIIGVNVTGGAHFNGVSARVSGTPATSATGLRFAPSSNVLLGVNDSEFFVSLATSTAFAVAVDPTGSATLNFDHSKAVVGLVADAANSIGLRTDGGTSRIGSSIVGGGDADVSEADTSQARCVGVYDAAYVSEVTC